MIPIHKSSPGGMAPLSGLAPRCSASCFPAVVIPLSLSVVTDNWFYCCMCIAMLFIYWS